MKKLTSSMASCVLGAGLAAMVAACSSPYGGTSSPSATSRGTRPAPTPGAATGSATSSGYADSGAPSGGGAWDAGGGGAPAADDAGGGGTATGAFLGEATAWASAPVTTSARDHHTAAGQTAQQPQTECLGCHGAAGLATPFVAAGFVASQAGGTNGASDVEVRIWSTTEAAGASAHTDADGFFWIAAASTTVTAPFKAGARDATHTMLMPTQPPAGACNGASCHGGAQGAIHVP